MLHGFQRLKKVDRLLQAPFDYSQAFDLALKNTIVALPNRPARESSENAVSAVPYAPRVTSN